MIIDKLREQYWFHDGAIKSFRLEIQNSSAEIELLVRRHPSGKLAGQIHEEDLIPCTLQITFEGLIEISLFDKFPTEGNYLNFSAFGKDGEEVCISFNVHDSSSSIYEKDNWVIKAKRIIWKEI